MQSSHPPLVRTRLSALMFLEFFIWGGWGIALAVYSGELGFSETQGSWLMATPALGAIISPLFMGLIADRYFAAERLLAVLHLLGGACLVAALSLADITAISLVRVPSVGTISLTLIEKMHRFEEGMLVALSLWLASAALPPAALMALALRRRR